MKFIQNPKGKAPKINKNVKLNLTKTDLYKIFGSMTKYLFHKGRLISGAELRTDSEKDKKEVTDK